MLGLAAVVPLLATVAWLLVFSGIADVRAVAVEGARERVTAEEVRAAAGTAPGSPLVRVDVDGVERRIARLPAVAAVAVERDWSARTLRVAVRERVPLATVPAPGGGSALLDETGAVLAVVPVPPPGLPPLTGRPGDRLDPASPAARAALHVLHALPDPLRRQVRGAVASSPLDVTLDLDSAVRVTWGGPERSDRKAAVLAALLPRGAASRVTSYDVSAPDVAVTR